METKAREIVSLLGGEVNIISVVNCMTRARFVLKDKSKIDADALKQKDYVLGLNDAGDQYQVIVGPGNAQKIVTIINEQYNFNHNNIEENHGDNDWQENKQKYKKQSTLSNFLKKIGEVFIPMIPGFIASGILLGIANIIINVNTANNVTDLPAYYYFIHAIGMALYGYLAIFTGINTAKSFGGTEILGGIIGGLTVSADLSSMFLALGASDAFANSMSAKGGIFGVLFAVIFMSFVEKKIRRIIPGVLDLILTPIITLLITGIATVFGFMFIAGELTNVINDILTILVGQHGILSLVSGAIMAGCFLPLVTFGLHQGFTPIYINEIATNATHATYIFPIVAMAGAGQVGAAIAIFFKAKKINDHRMQKIIAGAIIPGFLGVGEPLIYGVTLPLGKPFITAGMGAAVGGAFIAFAKVGAVATGPSGLTALPLIIPTDMLQYLLGLILAYLFGFIFTHLFYEYKK